LVRVVSKANWKKTHIVDEKSARERTSWPAKLRPERTMCGYYFDQPCQLRRVKGTHFVKDTTACRVCLKAMGWI